MVVFHTETIKAPEQDILYSIYNIISFTYTKFWRLNVTPGLKGLVFEVVMKR